MREGPTQAPPQQDASFGLQMAPSTALWKGPLAAGALLCSQPPSLPQVIFRFALALFKYKEEEILKLQDPMSMFKYLRYFTRTVLEAR